MTPASSSAGAVVAHLLPGLQLADQQRDELLGMLALAEGVHHVHGDQRHCGDDRCGI